MYACFAGKEWVLKGFTKQSREPILYAHEGFGCQRQNDPEGKPFSPFFVTATRRVERFETYAL